jgi:hypothetical protein
VPGLALAWAGLQYEAMTGELPPAGQGGLPAAHGELRASHEDRDQVVEQLRVAAGDGRLTAEELDERLEQALNARTYRELAVLTADLPAAGLAGPPRPGELRDAKELVRIQCNGSNTERSGPWAVPRRMELQVIHGNVKLDFTEAIVASRVLELNVDVKHGNLILVTRPGVAVDTDDVTMNNGNVRVRAPWRADVPEVLRVAVSGRVRHGNFVARPRYRSLWQWLRRAPRPWEAQPQRQLTRY